jgi:hypothetical protein
MTRDMIAVAVLVWLVGAIVGWCAGWAARGEQTRGWHRGLAHHLAQTRHDLAQALAELDELTHTQYATQPVPASAVVHVHVSTPVPGPVAQPTALDSTPFLDATPVLPAKEVHE